MLTIFIPSGFEAGIALKQLSKRKKHLEGGVPVWKGFLGGQPARVCVCGMGLPHSARRIRAVLAAVAPQAETDPVWLAGFGGGLDPSLRRYDWVWLAADNSPVSSAIVPKVTISGGTFPRQITSVFTSDEVVDTEAKKRAAFERTGAPIVDMETGPFLELLREFKRDGAVLRIISDEVSDEFPADLICHSYNFERGTDTPLHFAWHLLTHPRDIPRLRHFLSPLWKARTNIATFLTTAARRLQTHAF